MLVDWEHHWLSFSLNDTDITLLGTAAAIPDIAVVEVCSLLTTEDLPILPKV